MDYNSIENQRIKSEFVKREIMGCVTMLIQDALTHGQLLTYDDMENCFVIDCPDCGTLHNTWEYNEDEEVYFCPDCSYTVDEEPETEPQEIYEWWLVTDWVGEKLQDLGEPILSDGYNSYWGRGCSGQAIKLDYVIGKICDNMGILDGQPSSWTDKI